MTSAITCADAVANMRAAAAKPERRQQLLALCARNNADPQVQARRSALMRKRMRAAWADPEQRAQMLAGAAAGRQKIREKALEREARKRADPSYARGHNPFLSAEQKAMIVAAVAAGERRIMVAVDWLITESRVGQIVREAQKAKRNAC